MHVRASRWLLAGALLPASLRAQSISQTKAEVRLFEQPSGGVLGAEKRVYTYYFNTLRTRYIGVEVALDYAPAASDLTLSIGCQLTRPDGSVVDGIWRIRLSVAAGSTHAEGANYLFGAGKDGWQAGIHKVACSASRPTGETSFQMSPGPSLLADTEFRLKDVRFFPTGPKLPPAAERNYQDRFSGSEATRIGIELSFVHPGLSKSGEVPIDCYFMPSTGSVMGMLSFVYTLTPPATSGSGAIGIGWDEPGHWARGDYLAICQIHGRPISVDRFSVR